VAVVLVLVVRGQSHEPEYTRLTGKTSRGQSIGLTLLDGRLQSFDVYPSGFCRPERVWRSWLWYPASGDADVEQEGSRFTARERSNLGVGGKRVEWVALMSGELGDSGSSARGTIRTNWSYDDGPDDKGAVCRGRVSFSAG
jgi:hypothetical protein